MRIRKLTLPASDVSASAAFFRDMLELPANGNVIQVGWSDLKSFCRDTERQAVADLHRSRTRLPTDRDSIHVLGGGITMDDLSTLQSLIDAHRAALGWY